MPDPFSAIVIDDDREMRESLEVLLDRAGWQVTSFADATHALAKLDTLAPDAIVTDVRMPGLSGLELLEVVAAGSGPPVVLISAHGDIPMAVGAMQEGAYSFLEKPFEPRRLLTILQHAAESHRLSDLTRRMRADLMTLSGLDRVLLGNDPAITALRSRITEFAQSAAPVLLTGATGTGKEVVARALHRLGPRRDGRFVAVNCATLAGPHADDQLFGTMGSSKGFFGRAEGGTLFLDEIAACPPDAQAKLLRAIETGEILPLGADDERPVDLRIIAATHEDLSEAPGFRPDLFFRLNALSLHLPPLADRGEDIVLLFEHFLNDLSETYEITPPDMTADDAAALLSHDWPGNVRELRHVAERRVLAARRGAGSVAQALAMDDQDSEVPATLREAVAHFERTLIAKAIRAHGGRMEAVAEALGIGRRTLNEKIVKLGLDKSELLE